VIDAWTFSLMIKGDPLSFVSIENRLSLTPTRLTRKGQIVSKVIGPAISDVWVHEVQREGQETQSETLKRLVKKLSPHRLFIRDLAHSAEVRIRCFVQSDYAQVGLELEPEAIAELAHLSVKFDIAILSWGGVNS